MNLEAMAMHLEAAGCGTCARTIFVTEFPASCQLGILLMDPQHGTPVNHEIQNYFKSEMRLVVRGKDYAACTQLCRDATTALKTTVGYDAGGMWITQCLPETLPRPYRRSVAGYWEFEVDFFVIFVDEAT